MKKGVHVRRALAGDYHLRKTVLVIVTTSTEAAMAFPLFDDLRVMYEADPAAYYAFMQETLAAAVARCKHPALMRARLAHVQAAVAKGATPEDRARIALAAAVDSVRNVRAPFQQIISILDGTA